MGTWWIVSEKDPRWNCDGAGYVGGLAMNADAKARLKTLEAELGAPPDDLRYGCRFPGCGLLRSSVQHVKDGQLSQHIDFRWHEFVEPTKTKDWAEECAERWADKAYEGVTEIDTAILRAIREALEKAAELALANPVSTAITTDTGQAYNQALRDAASRIRALGAK